MMITCPSPWKLRFLGTQNYGDPPDEFDGEDSPKHQQQTAGG